MIDQKLGHDLSPRCITCRKDLSCMCLRHATDSGAVYMSRLAGLALKLHLHTAINRADFVSWCMLYTHHGNKIHS